MKIKQSTLLKVFPLFKVLLLSLIIGLWPAITTAQIMVQEPATASATDVATETDAEPVDNHSERIVSFHTDIRIDASGMMHLTEKIQVYANGDQIKRGLVRRIPIYRKDIFGDRKQADFKITGILKDGKKENYKTKNDGSVRSIYIGNEVVVD